MTKRDAICDAALELFAEQGIEATTIRDIAQRADAAEGTLYRHFKGKDDLAGWLYQRCAQELKSRLAEATEAAATPAEKLEALIRGVFDFFGDRPTSCTYLLSNRSEDAGGDGQASSTQASTDVPPPLGFFVEVIEAGQDKGAFQNEEAPLLAGWILAMVQRTVLFLKAGTLNGTRASAIDRTVHGALRLVTVN
jgi:AcrR family transcriptional regulator